MKTIVLINGPNLGRLGQREPHRYGTETLDQIVSRVARRARRAGLALEHFQSDIEGELVRRINAAAGQADGLIINPGAYAHTSVALRDSLLGSGLPCLEVHLTNIYQRESFRHASLTAPACLGVITGLGSFGYELALDALARRLADTAGEEIK